MEVLLKLLLSWWGLLFVCVGVSLFCPLSETVLFSSGGLMLRVGVPVSYVRLIADIRFVSDGGLC